VILYLSGKKKEGLEMLRKSLKIGEDSGFPDVSQIEKILKQFEG